MNIFLNETHRDLITRYRGETNRFLMQIKYAPNVKMLLLVKDLRINSSQ